MSDPPAEQQPDAPDDTEAGAQKPRPWYLVAAMCLMWLMGVAGMLSGCEQVEYLRGNGNVVSQLSNDAEQTEHPITRAVAVRERAWIEALGRHHRRAFPISSFRMLVAFLLVVGSGGALAGRMSSRRLTLQAIAANAAVAAAAFVLLAPARYAAANAVAEDAVENTVGVPQGKSRDVVMTEQHTIAMQREHSMALLELALFGAAAIALTTKRTKAFFASVPEPMADGDP